jgi:hypothetical protein
MRLVNAFCRYVEIAARSTSAQDGGGPIAAAAVLVDAADASNMLSLGL